MGWWGGWPCVPVSLSPQWLKGVKVLKNQGLTAETGVVSGGGSVSSVPAVLSLGLLKAAAVRIKALAMGPNDSVWLTLPRPYAGPRQAVRRACGARARARALRGRQRVWRGEWVVLRTGELGRVDGFRFVRSPELPAVVPVEVTA